jgi:hypothetical protein
LTRKRSAAVWCGESLRRRRNGKNEGNGKRSMKSMLRRVGRAMKGVRIVTVGGLAVLSLKTE